MSTERKPIVSVVMPVYGAELTVAEAVSSVLDQSFGDFELIVVDDGCLDASIDICHTFNDERIRVISQQNRGLAGARNTGIRHARGQFIALIDADDSWVQHKLEQHVIHLSASPKVGISYAASQIIDEAGRKLPFTQSPRLKNIRTHHIFLRNPIGNGSTPVLRREVFEEVSFLDPRHGELAYFDETFRQSEDIECWMRIALTTDWVFEGIEGVLTNYRVGRSSLSANVSSQLETWERVANRVAAQSQAFFRRWGRVSRGYQLRYLARRSVQSGDPSQALAYCIQAFKEAPIILLSEPVKSLSTLLAAGLFVALPEATADKIRTRFFNGRPEYA